MKKNISIIGLTNSFKKSIAKKLADELEMVFADVNDLMEYNLINDEMLAVAGQDYYNKNERKTLETVLSYQNTVLTVNFSTLNKLNNFDILKQNSLIIYVALNYADFQNLSQQEYDNNVLKLNQIVFNDRDLIMRKYADIVVEVNHLTLNNVIEKTLDSIGKYYKI